MTLRNVIYNYLYVAVFGGDPKRLKLMGGDYVRRSSRRVKVRGEREFIVNSDMMLRDFKVKVSTLFTEF